MNDNQYKIRITELEKEIEYLHRLPDDAGISYEIRNADARRILKEYAGDTPANIAPGTKVYELVEELAKYLSDEYTMRFM